FCGIETLLCEARPAGPRRCRCHPAPAERGGGSGRSQNPAVGNRHRTRSCIAFLRAKRLCALCGIRALCLHGARGNCVKCLYGEGDTLILAERDASAATNLTLALGWRSR